jgi:carbonic anhydrase
VREDLARLRACRLFPAGYQVLGFVYDVTTGRLEAVEPESHAAPEDARIGR